MKQNPVRLYLDSLSTPASRRSMRNVLDKFLREQMHEEDCNLEEYPWSKVRVDDIVSFKTQLIESGSSIAAINAMLAGVRSVLYKSMFSDAIPPHQQCDMALHEALKGIKTIRPTPASQGVTLSADDKAYIFQNLGNEAQGLRDKALLAALWGKRISAEEIATVTIESAPAPARKGESSRLVYLPHAGALNRIGAHKERIPLSQDEQHHIQRWLEHSFLSFGDPLFVRIRRNTISASEPLTKSGVEFALKAINKALSLDLVSLRNIRNASRN